MRSAIPNFVFVVWLFGCFPSFSLGQAIPRIPAGDYYLAYDFLEDGQTVEALAGLQGILARNNVNGQQPGLESIAVHVLIGECFFMQGNLGMAMENYDRALTISMNVGPWLERLQENAPLQTTDAILRGIDWATNSRNTTPAVFSAAWPMTYGTPGVAILLPTGDAFAAGGILPVDALEILRMQAVALRRRAQILGPLAEKSPLTSPLVAYYGQSTRSLPIPIQRAFGICNALATLGKGDANAAERILQQNMTLPGNLDYALTPIALQSLADLAIEKGDLQLGAQLLIQCTLIAATYEQFDILTEAVDSSVGPVLELGNPSIIRSVSQLARWSRGKSRLLQVGTALANAEWAIESAQADVAKPLLAASIKTLQQREIVLPRFESRVAWLQGRTFSMAGNEADALAQFSRAIALFRGGDGVSTASRPVFRLSLINGLAKNQQLPSNQAFPLLERLLDPPSATEYLQHPIECMVWQTSNKLAESEQLFFLAELQKDDEKMFSAIDRIQRQAYWNSLPFGGRLLSLRMLFDTKRSLPLPGEFDDLSNEVRSKWPTLSQRYLDLEQKTAAAAALPVELDTRKWDKPQQQTWTSVAAAGRATDEALQLVNTSRNSFPHIFPFVAVKTDLQSRLADDEAIVSFIEIGPFFYRLSISKTAAEIVQLGSRVELGRRIANLLTEMGVGQSQPLLLPSVSKGTWKSTLEELRRDLFGNQWDELVTRSRVWFVPTRELWFVPFELMDHSGDPLCSLVRIAYAPTIGLIPSMSPTSTSSQKSLIVHEIGFVSQDETVDRDSVEVVANASPNPYTLTVDRTARTLQSGRLSRLQFDRVIALAQQMPKSSALLSPMGYSPNDLEATLNFWLNSPTRAPQEILLPAYVPANVRSASVGLDIFEISCSLVACGTNNVLLSRWPVKGVSTQSLLVNYVEELGFAPATEALQQARETLWAINLAAESEPILGNSAKGPNSVLGSEPIFWSGYLQIGDPSPN